eukprot:9475366-Pyramimonas_sp.AAC.2
MFEAGCAATDVGAMALGGGVSWANIEPVQQQGCAGWGSSISDQICRALQAGRRALPAHVVRG